MVVCDCCYWWVGYCDFVDFVVVVVVSLLSWLVGDGGCCTSEDFYDLADDCSLVGCRMLAVG